MQLIRRVFICLGWALLAAAPALAQEATPASEADLARLNAAGDQFLGADTWHLSLDLAVFIGGAEDEPPLIELAVSGKLALDLVNELGGGAFNAEMMGDPQEIHVLMSGETLYLRTVGPWYGMSLTEVLGGGGGGDSSLAGGVEEAGLLSLDLGAHSEMWRLADEEEGLLRLQNRLNLISLVADPALTAAIGAVLTDELAGQANMASEELTALLPLLAFILQEPRIDTTYSIETDSRQLREIAVEIDGALNPAALGAAGEPITIDIDLTLGIAQGLAVTIGVIPTDATPVTLDELISGALP